MKRMRNKILPEISETQFGFMSDKGTRNATFALKTRMERSIEVQKDIYLCFIYYLYSKACDKVRHSDLFDILAVLNIDEKDLRVLIKIHWEQEAAIRVDNDISQYGPICRDVKQGCVLSPNLFNVCREIILQNIENQEGISVGGHIINNLRYGDDTVLIADSEEKQQKIFNKVTEESKKERITAQCKEDKIPHCNIACNGDRIRQINTLIVLSHLMASVTQKSRRESYNLRQLLST
ncbi:endonuclease-reverse transcriptase [Plakobranchus ocellatus]|uniref:Endonuclease-reverse transcriptase n=1 Tax=Plakobranchus ocellatus TaxID=259542 RepID=A0AAV3ZWF4_9GAST|nr:endonuclease-reverse transcriptase [Plakobranchus ocellatus]